MNPQADIAVVGSGAAGIAAAVTAARAGCSTILLDRSPAAGGTGGFSGLTTICGLFDDAGNFLNDGFAREFTQAVAEADPLRMGKVWVQPYRAEKFREVAARLFAQTPGLQTRWNEPVNDVKCEAGRITSINGWRVGAVVDCSGTAEVARAVGAECLVTDETTQAPAVIFLLHRVQRPLQTAADVAQVLLPLARAGLPPISLQPSLEPEVASVKFSGAPAQVPEVIEFLRTNVPGFEHCATPQKEFTLARRAGRMILGEYVLTGADVLGARKFPDSVARGTWPIEQWNAQGVVRLRYLPPGTHYEIPARSLRAAQVANLFMAGKTLSADTDAVASARVMGCCLATGAAAGNLAAASLASIQT